MILENVGARMRRNSDSWKDSTLMMTNNQDQTIDICQEPSNKWKSNSSRVPFEKSFPKLGQFKAAKRDKIRNQKRQDKNLAATASHLKDTVEELQGDIDAKVEKELDKKMSSEEFLKKEEFRLEKERQEAELARKKEELREKAEQERMKIIARQVGWSFSYTENIFFPTKFFITATVIVAYWTFVFAMTVFMALTHLFLFSFAAVVFVGFICFVVVIMSMLQWQYSYTTKGMHESSRKLIGDSTYDDHRRDGAALDTLKHIDPRLAKMQFLKQLIVCDFWSAWFGRQQHRKDSDGNPFKPLLAITFQDSLEVYSGVLVDQLLIPANVQCDSTESEVYTRLQASHKRIMNVNIDATEQYDRDYVGRISVRICMGYWRMLQQKHAHIPFPARPLRE